MALSSETKIMELTELYKACLIMKKGTEQTFQLAEAPPAGWVANITGRLMLDRKEVGSVSLRRSDTTIFVRCY